VIFPGIMRNTGAALLILAFLVSCSGKTVDRSAEVEVEPLLCVALLPTIAPYNDDTGVKGSIESGREGIYRETAAGNGDLRAGADYLYGQLQTELENMEVTELIEVSELKEQIREVTGGKLGVIKEIGKQARCGAVLMSTLTTFRQRQGGTWAVDLPASAAFELQLVEAHSGKTLWISSFNETQASLMSNLFSFGKAQRRGFKWITVEELVAQGVSEKIEECPYFR